MQSRFSEQERSHAVEQVRQLIIEEGWSQREACIALAEEVGVASWNTIRNWAKALGNPLPTGPNWKPLPPKTAKRDDEDEEADPDDLTVVAADEEESLPKLDDVPPPDFDQAQRTLLSNRLFQAIWMTASVCVGDAKALKDLSTAFTLLVDKRRLEDGTGIGPGRMFSEDEDGVADLESVVREGRTLLRVVGGTQELKMGERYSRTGEVIGRELTVSEKYGESKRRKRK